MQRHHSREVQMFDLSQSLIGLEECFQHWNSFLHLNPLIPIKTHYKTRDQEKLGAMFFFKLYIQIWMRSPQYWVKFKHMRWDWDKTVTKLFEKFSSETKPGWESWYLKCRDRDSCPSLPPLLSPASSMPPLFHLHRTHTWRRNTFLRCSSFSPLVSALEFRSWRCAEWGWSENHFNLKFLLKPQLIQCDHNMR